MDQITSGHLPGQAPEWVLSKVIAGPDPTEDNLSEETTDTVLNRLAEHCPVFADDWVVQQNEGLPEPDWLHWSSLLVHAGQTSAAMSLSSLSSKHDAQSHERITKLSSEPRRGTTRCTTFGCSEEQIASCFGGKLNRNDKGQITNSPGKFARTPKRSRRQVGTVVDLSSVGFTLDKETGRPTRLNANIFSKHIVEERLDIVYVQPGRFYLFENGLWRLLNDNELKRMLRNILHEYCPNFWKSRLEEEYIKALALEAQSEQRMDTARQYINLDNGMLDLNTFSLLPHDKKYFSTVRIPISYDQAVDCPTFRAFLEQVFEGDNERISLVAEMFGYCLTPDVSAQKAFILYGKGANGKSVLADILGMLVGPANTCALTLNDLEKPFARSELVDKQLILSTENETDSKGINTQFLKAITSGDAIRVERKHEQGFMYRPFCKVVLGTNNLPYSRDKSFAFIRRLVIIPFNRTFTQEEADVRLTDKLKSELPGILNFALDGLQRLRDNGFVFSASQVSKETLHSYEEELNPIARFVDEHIKKGTGTDRVENETLAKLYRIWCKQNGHDHPLSNQKLLNAVRSTLKAKGINSEPLNSAGKRWSTGIKLEVTITDDSVPTFTTVDSIDLMD